MRSLSLSTIETVAEEVPVWALAEGPRRSWLVARGERLWIVGVHVLLDEEMLGGGRERPSGELRKQVLRHEVVVLWVEGAPGRGLLGRGRGLHGDGSVRRASAQARVWRLELDGFGAAGQSAREGEAEIKARVKRGWIRRLYPGPGLSKE